MHDYTWLVGCLRWRNGIALTSMSTFAIHDNYYSGNCVLTVPLPVMAFDQADMKINSGFDACPTQRFTDPTLLTLFSSTTSDQYTFEMIPCGGPSPRLKNEIKDKSILKNLIASPVPSSNYVSIVGARIGDDLYLYDVLGNLIQKNEVNDENFQIDISHIPSGVYYIKSLTNQCIKIVKTN